MWIFRRKGASKFSWRSTADEVTRGIEASALTAIVTGASSGIGTETTRVLASCGVHVIMAVRNVDKGKTVKETIIESIPDAKIDVMELDLASFASVRKFVSEYKSLDLPLNLLINNAGVASSSFKLSKDDVEMQFATNHLGHFLLTNLLLDNMKKTARKSQREGRIVNVSSMAHQYLNREKAIRFDKINDSSSYSGMSAYGWSKLANILHTNELARRFKEEGVEITANSLHPGAILTSLLSDHGLFYDVIKWICRPFLKTIPQGAATTCYVALHPQVKGVTGASNGIGAETTRVLASCGIHVIMAVRDVDRGKKVKDTLMKKIPDAKIDVKELDLASFASVRKFASEFKSLDLPLNILMYSGLSAYGRSKLANILHANELSRRLLVIN